MVMMVNRDALEALQHTQVQELLRLEQQQALGDVRKKWMEEIEDSKRNNSLSRDGKNGVFEGLLSEDLISKVDSDGNVVYDTRISQEHPIHDFFTWISGIRRRDLTGAPSLEKVQKDLYGIFHGNILVGHGLRCDLKVDDAIAALCLYLLYKDYVDAQAICY
ncbi:unnamed protein product [Calypogeia fissa]